METDAAGTPKRAYVWLNGRPLAQLDSTGIVYLHTDHLDTPRLATNAQGTVVWRWEGEAFGDTQPNEDADGDGSLTTVNLRFPGQYYDQETGLHYNWNRYYDPKIGRYITSDPIGPKAGLNTFAYVDNNPLRWTDPEGLVRLTRMYFPDPLTPAEERNLMALESQFMKVAAEYEKVLQQSCVGDRK